MLISKRRIPQEKCSEGVRAKNTSPLGGVDVKRDSPERKAGIPLNAL